MSNALSRRLLLRGLPMAPAMAKQAVGEIVKQAAGKAIATLDIGNTLGGLGPQAAGGFDAWELANKWVMEKVRSGAIPDHKAYEYRRHARFLARAALDPDIEALGSVSSSHKRRMHEESAYRATARQDVEDYESRSLFQSVLDKFSGRKS